MRSWKLDSDQGTRKRLELPDGHLIHDLSGDGKTLLTTTKPTEMPTNDFSKIQIFLSPMDTLKPEIVSDLHLFPTRVSNDGLQILGIQDVKSSIGGLSKIKYAAYDIKKKTLLEIPDHDDRQLWEPMWATSGKSIVSAWHQREDSAPGIYVGGTYFLGTINSDSKSAKPIFQLKLNESITDFDYR